VPKRRHPVPLDRWYLSFAAAELLDPGHARWQGVDCDYVRDSFCLPPVPLPTIKLGEANRVNMYSWWAKGEVVAVALEALSLEVDCGRPAHGVDVNKLPNEHMVAVVHRFILNQRSMRVAPAFITFGLAAWSAHAHACTAWTGVVGGMIKRITSLLSAPHAPS
jgi:hypothetical protein